MPDYPDYTKPITITGVTIETLPIDIKAQTVGNITIDVAAQSVGNLNIDIKAVSDAVPVSNLGCLVNVDFEDDWQGWMYADDCFIDDTVRNTGYKSVKIGHMKYVAQELSPALRGDRVKSLRVAYRSQVAGANKAIVTLINSDGTVTQTYLSPAAADTWYTIDVTTDPTKEAVQFGLMGYAGYGKYVWFDTIGLALKEVVDAVNVTVNVDIVAQTVGNINVDIVAQTVGNLAVDIAAQTVGNISIDIAAQTVGNLNVDIKAQTVDLNIKTSGGVNLVIDKLTQTAYLEDRRTLSNNGETPAWHSPTGDVREGKFFPRGCRGFINTIDVYCKNVGATPRYMTVYISPHPSMGYITSAIVTVPAEAAEDWRSATFNHMWNYDSMFIFVLCSTTDVKIAYDAGAPHDRYQSTDAGATWTAYTDRGWFRAVMKAMTVGDLPVSGTINVIEIPSVSSGAEAENVTVPHNTWTDCFSIEGAGELEHIIFVPRHSTMTFRFIVDGVNITGLIFTGDITFNADSLNAEGYTVSTPFIQLTTYEVNSLCRFNVKVKLKWRRQFKLQAFQTTGSNQQFYGALLFHKIS